MKSTITVLLLVLGSMGCSTVKPADDQFYIHEPGKEPVARVCEKPCLSDFDKDAMIMGLGR